ncbi:unnamed protein product [Ectocarpus sp. 12 AP-2014]
MGRPSLLALLVVIVTAGVVVVGRISLSPLREKMRAEERHRLNNTAVAAANKTSVFVPTRRTSQQDKGRSLEGEAAPFNSEARTTPLSLATKRRAGVGPLKIKYISLIGERHSGTTWMVKFLQDYFRDKDITVTATLCTWKHWFQDRIYQDIQDGKRLCREGQQCPACKDINHTLVVAMWRNPYDWISGMHKIPWHAQAHASVPDMSKFMTMPWIMSAEEEKKARKEALIRAKDELPCIDNFLPWEVLPCRPGDESAIYELDPSGEAYGNIYELRKAKIRDFDAVKMWAPFYEKILYEDMLAKDGLKMWLMSLDTLYGLGGNYKSVPDSALAAKMESSRKQMYYLNSQHCAPHCKMGGMAGRSALETMNRLWDEELEKYLGYHQVR